MSGCGSIWTRAHQITKCPSPEPLPVLCCEDGHSSFCLYFGDSGISLDSARCGPSSPTVACCSQHTPEILEFQRLLPYRIMIQVGKSSQIVLSSHSTTTASAPARGGPKCDGCQKTANFFPSLSISKMCLKAVISYLV